MLKWADHATDIADILATQVTDDNEVRASLGYYDGVNATSFGIGAGSPYWQDYGFASRPADPDENGAAMALYLVDGDQKRVIATRDNRYAPLLAKLKPGETIMHGPTGAFIRFHADGGISMLTTDDATTDGESIYFRVSPEDGFIWKCPWGVMRFGPLGFHMTHCSGARIDCGGMSAQPPLNALSNYASMTAAMVNLFGSAVSLGTDGGANNYAAVMALQAWITAVSLAFTHATPASGMTGDNTSIQTALGALTAVIQNLGKVA